MASTAPLPANTVRSQAVGVERRSCHRSILNTAVTASGLSHTCNSFWSEDGSYVIEAAREGGTTR